MKDRLFEIWFALCCGAGNREFQAVLEACGSPYEIYKADETELEQLPCSHGLKRRLADKSLKNATSIMEYCRQSHVGLLFWQDGEYPASLRTLQAPPVLLYYRGDLPRLAKKLCISVVGTRSMSEYGKRIAYRIGYELGASGTVVVSGMALGNDGVAAAGAILAGGSTVAVLGSGIDVLYPREHGTLLEAIVERGAIVTEFPPGTPPERMNFPVRNRLISGLSQGTVVVEADLKSGALITARQAILQGRDIYAFPGNVGETNSSGTNKLISDGAVMILRARDLLENYSFLYGDLLDMRGLSRAETHAGIDEEGLARLGVCVRTEKPKEAEGLTVRSDPERTYDESRAPDTPAAHAPIAYAPTSADKGREGRADTRRSRTPAKIVESEKAKDPAPTQAVPARGDASERILKSLTDTQRGIFEALPLDQAVAIDYLTREGFSVGEIMAAMTVLEIKGLTVTLPGGLYARK